jgi:general secretion pathway protein E
MTDEKDTAPELLVELVRRAEEVGASDVHLQMTGKTAGVFFRLDGVMVPASVLTEGTAERVFGRIKDLARLKTYQESLPQDGRIAKSDLGTQCDLRVATYPTVTGEKIVLRLFQKANCLSLKELDLPAEATAALEGFLRGPGGLLLLTGPAGSGKTTTIYACLQYLIGLGGRHVITVEDPVEQIIPGIMQTEINEPVGLTFAKAARHLLRQDPQVLVIGEMRDTETASLAVHAALTGHLVISTLHAGSCQGVFERMQLMCPDRHAVMTAMALVFNQRLMRKVCRFCPGAGCEKCLHTGYLGRTPVVEWYGLDAAKRRTLYATGTDAVQPSPTLEESARELCRQGVSNEKEYQRIMGI